MNLLAKTVVARTVLARTGDCCGQALIVARPEVAWSEVSGLASRTDLYEEVGEPSLSESGQVLPDCRLDQGGECPSGEMERWCG